MDPVNLSRNMMQLTVHSGIRDTADRGFDRLCHSFQSLHRRKLAERTVHHQYCANTRGVLQGKARLLLLLLLLGGGFYVPLTTRPFSDT